MQREKLTLSILLPVAPERLFRAWLDSAEHAAFTGAAATVDPVVGGRHSAWDGYIEGEILALEPESRIVQSWRTSDFGARDPDSVLDLRFERERLPGDERDEPRWGTRLSLQHTELPRGGAARYTQGWKEFYFGPMRSHFDSAARRTPESAAPADARASGVPGGTTPPRTLQTPPGEDARAASGRRRIRPPRAPKAPAAKVAAGRTPKTTAAAKTPPKAKRKTKASSTLRAKATSKTPPRPRRS